LRSSISATPKTNSLRASFPTLKTSLLSIGKNREGAAAVHIAALWIVALLGQTIVAARVVLAAPF